MCVSSCVKVSVCVCVFSCEEGQVLAEFNPWIGSSALWSVLIISHNAMQLSDNDSMDCFETVIILYFL